MAPTYRLTYFDVKGVAEPARFLLKYGGIEFEDVRVTDEEWDQLKEKTPFGQLPVLEHKGKEVAQSVAIARYLARIVKLAGKDDWENLEMDAVVDSIGDLRSKYIAAFWESDEAKKKILTETFINETLPYYLTRLDALAQKNKGFLVLGHLTWADLFLVSLASNLDDFVGGNSFAKYSSLEGLRERVEALPNIKKWLEERPKREF